MKLVGIIGAMEQEVALLKQQLTNASTTKIANFEFHRGHLHVITQLFKQDLIDQLLLIPAGQPLLRSSEPTASPETNRKYCLN